MLHFLGLRLLIVPWLTNDCMELIEPPYSCSTTEIREKDNGLKCPNNVSDCLSTNIFMKDCYASLQLFDIAQSMLSF